MKICYSKDQLERVTKSQTQIEPAWWRKNFLVSFLLLCLFGVSRSCWTQRGCFQQKSWKLRKPWGMSVKASGVWAWLWQPGFSLEFCLCPNSFSTREVKGWHSHIRIYHTGEQRELETQMEKEHTDESTYHFHMWTLPEVFQVLSSSILSCSYPLGGLLRHRLGNSNCAISQGRGQQFAFLTRSLGCLCYWSLGQPLKSTALISSTLSSPWPAMTVWLQQNSKLSKN